MPSLLDTAMLRPGAAGLLARRAGAERGLFGLSPVPEPPSLFNLGAPDAAFSGARQAAQQPVMGAPATQPQDRNAPLRQAAGGIASNIMAVTGGDLPRGAESWIRETAEATVGSGPGREGQGFLARLVLGDMPPGLSDAQKRRLLRSGLITAGLTALGTDSDGTSPLQALSLGLLIARQSAAKTAGSLLDRKRATQEIISRYQLLSNADMDEISRWEELRRRLASEGEVEAAETAGQVIEQLRNEQAGQDSREFKMINGVPTFVDPKEGAIYSISGERLTEPPKYSSGELSFEVVNGEPLFVDPVRGEAFDLAGNRITQAPEQSDDLEGAFREDVMVGGELHTVLFDRQGQPIRDLGPAEAPDSGPASDVSPATISTMDRELTTLVEIFSEREFEPFGLAETEAAEHDFTRGASSTEAQQARAAANNLLSLIIRQRSGAQATEAEVRRLAAFAVPEPGDDPETVRTKLQRLRDIIEDFRGGGGAAMSAGDDSTHAGLGVLESGLGGGS